MEFLQQHTNKNVNSQEILKLIAKGGIFSRRVSVLEKSIL